MVSLEHMFLWGQLAIPSQQTGPQRPKNFESVFLCGQQRPIPRGRNPGVPIFLRIPYLRSNGLV